MGHCKNNSAGFTLMELIVVLSVMMVMAASAIPYVMNTQAVNLDGAARKLEADIRYAQNLAITTAEDYGFRAVADGSMTKYEVYKVSDDSLAEDPYDHMDMAEDFATDFTGVTFSDDDHTIQFDNRGLPNFVSGSADITLQDQSSGTKTISVNNIGLISTQ